MGAVAGPMAGTRLTHLFLAHTTWGEWKAEHQTTLVLSAKNGDMRNYLVCVVRVPSGYGSMEGAAKQQ